MDQFEAIAAKYRTEKDRGLVTPQPPVLPDIDITLSPDDAGAFTVPEKMDTAEKLALELARQRERHAPFLRELAPAFDPLVCRTAVNEFDWSLEGGTPRRVRIPHYGGPVGSHTAEYTTDFAVSCRNGQRVFLCFKGVDYIVEGLVNGRFAGRHEGFFSPFEWDITAWVRQGVNQLHLTVKNDFNMNGCVDSERGFKANGDKIYAATGLGWDDPQTGWHHCPPGMGIYHEVAIEVREDAYITDLFPRFNENASELWVECGSAEYREREVSFRLSVYGRNFEETVMEDVPVYPTTTVDAGVGDTLTKAALISSGMLGKSTPLRLSGGLHRFVLPVSLPSPRIWSPQAPWLYQAQVKLVVDGQVKSVQAVSFGVRTFTQDLNSEPRGKFYLNGREIRLRGANTMGFEQQDVMRGDFDQLIDDILLAKIANMNYLRITQRPVQEEVYDYCDRLGLMVQTDLPLFGTVRFNQYCEVLRQTEEMEKLVRSHPCCILDSYINEPFPNAKNMPHRMLVRRELKGLFEAADTVIRLHNPDRVIKHVDGDYDPPDERMPDNHCYTLWYNGHGLDLGHLHKGYWLDIKPGWHAGCGEFGAEGLDFVDLMREEYPPAWLAEPFHPNNIVSAQTGRFHYCFYETPETMEEWVVASHRHQAFATKIMTNALRRNPLINTFAIHLFIDAFPSGWMKTIMDCRRRPKPAYFVYRDCLSPTWCHLRTDRFTVFSDDEVCLEAWYQNDSEIQADEIRYMVVLHGRIIFSARRRPLSQAFQGMLRFQAPPVLGRAGLTVHMAALADGRVLHDTQETITVFTREKGAELPLVTYAQYRQKKERYDQRIREGETVVFAPLAPGTYAIAGRDIQVTECRMSPLYVVSRDTGHPAVAGLEPNDMAYWYDSRLDRLAPLVYATLDPCGITPVLTCGNRDDKGKWETVIACGEWTVGEGRVILCQMDLAGKEPNPCAVKFVNQLAAYMRQSTGESDRHYA